MQTKKQKNSIKYGDLFSLGRHRLIAGDARDPEIIKRLVGKDKIKSVNCDPPYGVAIVESKSSFNQKISCPRPIINDHFQSEDEYKEFTKEWLENIKPYLDRKNSIYIFNSDKMIFSLREAMIDSGFKFAQLLIWIKNHAVLGRMDYLPQHELIAYGWYGRHKFRKSQDRSVIFYPKPNRSPLHPTMKPIGLLRRLILNSTEINDIIYDPFAGSGSLLIASEQTRRRCLLVEVDLEYCRTIIDRFEKITNIKARKIQL